MPKEINSMNSFIVVVIAWIMINPSISERWCWYYCPGFLSRLSLTMASSYSPSLKYCEHVHCGGI